MEMLIRCRCGHGVTTHTGDGCGTRPCPCPRTRETIIEEEIVAARAEIRSTWKALAP